MKLVYPRFSRRLIVTAIIAIVLATFGGALFYYTSTPQRVTRSADAVLASYLRGRTEVKAYQIKDRLWTQSCCARSIKTDAARSNRVRYTIRVQQGGSWHTEFIDLKDARDQAAQLYDEGSGNQRWEFSAAYPPGKTPPPATWSV